MKKCKAIDRGEKGVSIQWEDGGLSWMPDMETARAFSAALDLLAACERAYKEDDCECAVGRAAMSNPEYVCSTCQLGAAIAKATGGAA